MLSTTIGRPSRVAQRIAPPLSSTAPQVTALGAGPFTSRAYMILSVPTFARNGMPTQVLRNGKPEAMGYFIPHQSSLDARGMDKLGAHAGPENRRQVTTQVRVRLPGDDVVDMPWADVVGPMSLVENDAPWDAARVEDFREAGGAVLDFGDLGERAYADRLGFAVDWLRAHPKYHMLSNDANCMAYIRDEIQFMVQAGHLHVEEPAAFGRFLGLDLPTQSGETYRDAIEQCGLSNCSPGTSGLREDLQCVQAQSTSRRQLLMLERRAAPVGPYLDL